MEYPPAPSRPPSPAAEVHVWRAAAAAVPADEALARVLALYLGGEPGAIELVRGEHGKPRLAAEPERLAFNLSHSGGLALVAVTRGREVGVDVEREKPERDLVALAERALSPEDAATVRGAGGEERGHIFYALWARHEARLKCLGVGLGRPPAWPSPPVAARSLPIDPGYAAAVAVTGDAVPIRCWTLG
ncbi:MAG TPA: 4'-phosphopantetheinyl transferase superfamily protein [Solirubrobacterales bacterium]|nr:4'-phosphopantetheinyl transferase superfamily protein [Solirubrobacterales bacterium]